MMAGLDRYRILLVAAAMALLLPAHGSARAQGDQPLDNDVLDLLPRLFLPIPPSMGLDPGKVALGARLFQDPVLSKDRSIACASCHNLATGGGDGQPVSTGIGGKHTRRNALSVFNVGLQQVFFWDGRAQSLEDQIDGPINSKEEMDGDWSAIAYRLSQDLSYRKSFQALYGGLISEATIKDAIVEYERSLNTPGSRFDDFLAGDTSALSAEERQGLSRFIRLGCASCHQGMLLGANVFEKFGVYRRYNKNAGSKDLGRYAVTGMDYDKFVFKVPSLRNVALTAPYFHDGSEPDLEAAVRTMARIQLNKDLDARAARELVAFLKTLTGKLPADAAPQQAKR
jgi:cytochrome c peroxidase